MKVIRQLDSVAEKLLSNIIVYIIKVETSHNINLERNETLMHGKMTSLFLDFTFIKWSTTVDNDFRLYFELLIPVVLTIVYFYKVSELDLFQLW